MLEGGRRLISRGHKNVHGVYQAKVAIRNPASPLGNRWKTKFSTMFPDEWSGRKVITEVNAAYISAVTNGFTGTGKWIGKSPSGVKIEGMINSAGVIHQAFPIF